MCPTSAAPPPRIVRLAAREQVLRLLALAASDPASTRFERVFDPGFLELACAAATHLAGDPGSRPARLAPGEAPAESLDLTALAEAFQVPRERLIEDHTRVFGLVVSKECPPYEAEYAQPHIFQKTQCLADVAGFYRAFGLQLATDFHDRPDHVSAELEFMEFLCFKEIHGTERHPEARLAVGREAQVKFLGEHLGRWVFAFCRRLQDKAAGTHYRPLAALLRVFAASELRARGFDPAEVAGPDRLEQETPAPAGCGAHCPAAPSNPAAGGCP